MTAVKIFEEFLGYPKPVVGFNTGEDAHDRRERIEAARAEDERQERSWRAIFDVFDNDRQGSIDHEEMRDLLSKFSSDSTPAGSAQIEKIIALLDDDESGEVSFEEFFVFGRALEHHIAHSCDPAELLEDMFQIIDEDRGAHLRGDSRYLQLECSGTNFWGLSL